MADEHETESQAWAIEAAAAEAASRAAEEVHRPPVVPMERVVDRTDIERGERVGQKRSQEPDFPRFFAELNLGLILTAFAIVAFKTPNHFAFGGTSGVSVILSTLFPTLPVGVFMWIINAVLVVLGFIFLERKAILWSVFASFALSAYVSLFELFIPTDVSLTGDMWLDLCFAVILPALGSAIVFDIGASTGGTDIVAMIINRYRTISYGKILILRSTSAARRSRSAAHCCWSISASWPSRPFCMARVSVCIAYLACLPRRLWSTRPSRAFIFVRSARSFVPSPLRSRSLSSSISTVRRLSVAATVPSRASA